MGVIHSLASTTKELIEPDLNSIISCEHFGRFVGLLRVTAYLPRSVNNLKIRRLANSLEKQRGTKSTLNELKAEELDAAETLWIRSTRRASFSNEIELLKGKNKGLHSNRVRQFALYFDDDQNVRCRGRIKNSNLHSESKNAILSPTKHSQIELLVRDIHHKVKHNGVRDTLTTIRERYYILQRRETVKHIIKTCVICRKAVELLFQAQPN